MKVEIYYTPQESRAAGILAAFTRGLCGDRPLQLIRQEVDQIPDEFTDACESETTA